MQLVVNINKVVYEIKVNSIHIMLYKVSWRSCKMVFIFIYVEFKTYIGSLLGKNCRKYSIPDVIRSSGLTDPIQGADSDM